MLSDARAISSILHSKRRVARRRLGAERRKNAGRHDERFESGGESVSANPLRR